MEQQNYYVSNLETDKLNIYTTKDYYESLNVEQKKVFKSHCLFSRKTNCWISKGKTRNCWYLKSLLKGLNFEYRGESGERLKFEQQVQREQEKAAGKMERSENLAEKAEKRSDELFDTAKKMAAVIPFGQPILVGHHSEKSDRNYRARISNKFDQAFKESEKAGYYLDKADTARYTAEGAKYTNPIYLSKKIRECQKDIRICTRRLQGKFYSNSPQQPISEEAAAFYNRRINEENDKLGFYVKKMKEIEPNYVLSEPSKTQKNANSRKIN